ncbi:MAG: hypothetical protein VX834_03865 [Myxococcota bacterium]|nr:hypothetical protein [Myxococcota bacterium]
MILRFLIAAVCLTTACTAPVPDAIDTSGANGDDEVTCQAGEIVNDDGACVPACSEATCGPGTVCDAATGQCLPVDSGTEGNTANTWAGESGTTEGGCDPASCPDGYECPDDASSTQCVPIEDEGCSGLFDCDFGQQCVEGECVPVGSDAVTMCQDDTDCPMLMTCQVGVCVGCLDDLMCAEGRCILGVCVTADLGPGGDCIGLECSEGQACNWQTGVCEPTCVEDSDCVEGEFCSGITNFCTSEFRCDDDADCLTGSCVAGVCVGCQSDTECAEGLTCTFGACLPNEVGSDPCAEASCDPSTEACDPLDGSCYPADGSCSGDEDCREVHDCSMFGVCTGCEVDGDCRPDQRCILSACVLL